MAGASLQNVHATCAALAVGGTWHGVLLRGPSGAGKSDLAIRILEAGGRLIADDRTELSVDAGRLVARSPTTLAGLIEVRGLGVLRLPPGQVLTVAPVTLIVDLVDAAAVERLPQPRTEALLGIDIPCVQLAAFEASTLAKIRLALSAMRAT